MTKVKVYRDSTDIRYEGKQYVQFAGRFGSEYAQKVAPEVYRDWKARFEPYREKYAELKAYLEQKYPNIPKGMYGLYRSFLFYAYKHIQTGSSPEEVIKRFENNLSLKRDVMESILRHFGLYERPVVSKLKTNAEVGAKEPGSTTAGT